MKNHFLRLFDYTDWANRLILDALIQADAPPTHAVRWMNHIAGAQSVWLGRLDPRFPDTWGVWPDRSLDEVRQGLAENGAHWRLFIEREVDEGFRRIAAFKTTDGTPYETPLAEILTHVVNHSTHHRAQIASALRQAGIAPPQTDFIRFVRETSS